MEATEPQPVRANMPPPRPGVVRSVASWLGCATTSCIVAASLASFLGSLTWPWELATHFRVQYLLAATAAAVLLFLAGRRRWAAVAIFAAAVNLAYIWPLYVAPQRPAATPITMRVLSLNVYWLNANYEQTLDLIFRERPDFVVLSEVTPRWAQALHALDDDFPYSRVAQREGTTGIALYSQHPLVNMQSKRLLDMPVLTAEGQIGDQPFTLIGAHLSSPGSKSNMAARDRQIPPLAALVREQTSPVLLVGDLNTTCFSPKFTELVDESGLVDSEPGFGVQGSWPDLPAPLRIAIDHCLLSPQLRVHDRRVVYVDGSDHCALIVDFSWIAP